MFYILNRTLLKLRFVLLNIRVHPIVSTADFKKACLQTSIDEDQGDYLRFLWYQNLQEESIIKYRFTRVVDGATSSQFVLNGTVQTHSNKYEKIDPEFARKVKKSIFMWKILIVVYKAQKKVLNFNKKSKKDLQKQV